MATKRPPQYHSNDDVILAGDETFPNKLPSSVNKPVTNIYIYITSLKAIFQMNVFPSIILCRIKFKSTVTTCDVKELMVLVHLVLVSSQN